MDDATHHNLAEDTIIHTVGAWYDQSELITDDCFYSYNCSCGGNGSGSGGSGETDNSVIGYDVTGNGRADFATLSEAGDYGNVREVNNLDDVGKEILTVTYDNAQEFAAGCLEIPDFLAGKSCARVACVSSYGIEACCRYFLHDDTYCHCATTMPGLARVSGAVNRTRKAVASLDGTVEVTLRPLVQVAAWCATSPSPTPAR